MTIGSPTRTPFPCDTRAPADLIEGSSEFTAFLVLVALGTQAVQVHGRCHWTRHRHRRRRLGHHDPRVPAGTYSDAVMRGKDEPRRGRVDGPGRRALSVVTAVTTWFGSARDPAASAWTESHGERGPGLTCTWSPVACHADRAGSATSAGGATDSRHAAPDLPWAHARTDHGHGRRRAVHRVAAGRGRPRAASGCHPGPARAQPRESMSSRQALSQRRQASAQMRQCSCISAWPAHSSPQALQAAAQASRTARVRLAS